MGVISGFTSASADDASVPILRFHEVDAGVYRGARPETVGLEALQSMGFKTVVNLDDDQTANALELQDAARLGLREISIPMSGFWYPRTADVNQALAALRDPSNYPIFVHCKHGQDRTGLIIGLYRVFQDHWTPEQAHAEMLDDGFHRTEVLMNHYFEVATGYED